MSMQWTARQEPSTASVLWVHIKAAMQALAGVAIVTIGASAWIVEASAGARIAGFLVAGLGFGVVVGSVLRARVRPPEISVAVVNGSPATAIARSGGLFAVGMAMVAVTALTLAAWAVLAFVSGQAGWGLVLATVATWTGSVVLLAAAGRYTAGGMWFTPAGLTYRWRGLQTTVSWEGVGTVVDEPSRGYAALRGRPGSDLRHAFRAGPWHGEKLAAQDIALLRVAGTALGPVGLARIVEHYANHPQARSELGTSASLSTFASLNLDRGQ